MRISLARALFIEPTLLLDEPTNHLDLNGRLARSCLQKWKKTVLIVSHDQTSSTRCARNPPPRRAARGPYRGNYDTFKALEATKREQQQKAWEKRTRVKQAKAAASKAKALEDAKKAAGPREAARAPTRRRRTTPSPRARRPPKSPSSSSGRASTRRERAAHLSRAAHARAPKGTVPRVIQIKPHVARVRARVAARRSLARVAVRSSWSMTGRGRHTRGVVVRARARGPDGASLALDRRAPRAAQVEMEFTTVSTLTPPIVEVNGMTSGTRRTCRTSSRSSTSGSTRTAASASSATTAGQVALLSLVTGKLGPTDGEVKFNPRLRIGVYSQHFMDRLPMDEDPI